MPSINSSFSRQHSKADHILSSEAVGYDDTGLTAADDHRDAGVLIANDDDPSFPKFWHEGAKAQKKNLALALTTGGLIGVVLSILVYAIASFTDPQSGTGTILISLSGLIASGLTLSLLVFVIGKISGLANLIDRVSEFEKSLNKSGRVAALTRELESEAAQIESRIEQFLATGTGLRQELNREAHQINTLFSEKIETVRHTINDLDEARITFVNEVVYINQAIEIARNFLTAKIGSLTNEFESAALSGAKVLDEQMISIAEKIKSTLSDSRNHTDDLNRLIATNEKLIAIMNDAQNGMERHIDMLHANLQSSLDVNITRTTAEIEILSQRISRSSESLIHNLSSTPFAIESQFSTLSENVGSLFGEQSAHLTTQIRNSVAEVETLHKKLHTLVEETPRIIETKFATLEPLITHSLEHHIDTVNKRIEDAASSMMQSATHLSTVLDEAPRKLENYLARLTPTITSGFSENILLIEKHMADLLAKQTAANEKLLDGAKDTVHHLANEFETYKPRIAEAVGGGIEIIKSDLNDTKAQLQSEFEEFRATIQKHNADAINEIHGAISGQISQIRVMAEHIRSDLYKTVSSALEQQNIDIKDIEQKFEGITQTIRGVITDLARSSSDFGGSISTHIQAFDAASGLAVKSFGDALKESQDATLKSVTTELGHAQKNFVKEYSLTEERLFRSLSNLNDVVQNCISSLEESINWRQTSFEEQIKRSAEHNLSHVQSEVEQLVERMQSKIEELKMPAQAPTSSSVGSPQLQDSDVIVGLSRQMATINAILNDMRSGVKK